MPRPVAYSGKKKKAQLQAKRERKREESTFSWSDDDRHSNGDGVNQHDSFSITQKQAKELPGKDVRISREAKGTKITRSLESAFSQISLEDVENGKRLASLPLNRLFKDPNKKTVRQIHLN